MAKTVDEKLDDIAEEISGNSLNILNLEKKIDDLESNIEDIKKLLEKIINKPS